MMLRKSFYINFIIAVSVVITMGSCVNNTGNKISSSIQVGLEVNSFDSTLTAGNDSLQIENFKFVYGEGAIVVDGDSIILGAQPENYVQISVTQATGNPAGIIGNGLLPPGEYSGLELSVKRAPDNNTNIEPDFTEGNNFSFIIEGTYNDQDFTYRSTREFEVPFNFVPPTIVEEFNRSYLFLITTDAKRWFTNTNGGFYDPTDAANTSDINANVKASFNIDQIIN